MSLLQHYSLKASILSCSDFFTVQLSLLYVTTWKTIPLDYRNLCQQSNVSTFQYTVHTCHSLPAKKQSPSDFMAAVTIAVILETKRNLSLLSPFLPLFAMTYCSGSKLELDMEQQTGSK